MNILLWWIGVSFFVGGIYSLINYLDYKRIEARKDSLNKGEIRVVVKAEDKVSEKISKVLSDLARLDSSNSKESTKKPYE